MSTSRFYRNILAILVAATLVSASPSPTDACTRALYVAKNGTVIVGRSMDWGEDMASNMWVLPRGMKRDGRGGNNTISWESKYGSLIVSAYDIGTAIRTQALVMIGVAIMWNGRVSRLPRLLIDRMDVMPKDGRFFWRTSDQAVCTGTPNEEIPRDYFRTAIDSGDDLTGLVIPGRQLPELTVGLDPIGGHHVPFLRKSHGERTAGNRGRTPQWWLGSDPEMRGPGNRADPQDQLHDQPAPATCWTRRQAGR